MRAKYRKHSIRCPEYLTFLRHESGAAGIRGSIGKKPAASYRDIKAIR